MYYARRSAENESGNASTRGAASRCHTCPLGVASGVPEGNLCPFVPKEREAGALIYIEGCSADRVWYIERGQVSLSRESNESRGSSVTWALRRPGEMIGTEALITETYRDTAQAVTPVTLCSASRETLNGWLGPVGSPPRVVLHLMLRSRCQEAPRPSSADGSAPQRVARWILDEARGGLCPPVPRAVMANLLGMLPETLSRALARLVGAGAIAVDRKSIRVVDPAALLRAAGETDDEDAP